MTEKVFIALLLFLFPGLGFAQDLQEEDASTRREKTKLFCELNPLAQKCAKFLDAEYRRLKDAEKEYKEDSLYRRSEEKYQKDKRIELLTFCRKNPDSDRCPSK